MIPALPSRPVSPSLPLARISTPNARGTPVPPSTVRRSCVEGNADAQLSFEDRRFMMQSSHSSPKRRLSRRSFARLFSLVISNAKRHPRSVAVGLLASILLSLVVGLPAVGYGALTAVSHAAVSPAAVTTKPPKWRHPPMIPSPFSLLFRQAHTSLTWVRPCRPRTTPLGRSG